MRIPFYILFFCFSFYTSTAQTKSLPIVYAIGGEGKNVIFKKITKEERDNMPGYVWGVCSSCLSNEYCTIRASSTLATQGNVNYAAKNIQDDDPLTAWVEGDTEYGIGEFLEFKNASIYSSITIFNGYQKSPKSFLENSRVKSFRLSENGVDRCIIRLTDEMGGQSINTEELRLRFIKNALSNVTLRLTITEVYSGTKYKDVAISEIFGSGCCVSGNSTILLNNNTEKNLSQLSRKDSIKFLDNKNQIVVANGLEIDSVKHHNLLKIITKSNLSFIITPSHKLYKGSMFSTIQGRQLSAGDTLVMYDAKEGISFELVSEIETIDEPTQTYYYKNIDFGKQKVAWPVKAIFNRFVCSDEYLDKLNKQNTIKN
jgi:hypothetical protein